MKKRAIFILNNLLILSVMGCSDYVSRYEDRYDYLENESSASIEDIMSSAKNASSSSAESIDSQSLDSESLDSENLDSQSSSSKEKGSSKEKSNSSEESLSNGIHISEYSSTSKETSSSSTRGNYKGKYGELADSRDNAVYRTVTIDGQEWMAENLRYETGHSVCLQKKDSYCKPYGRFYLWKEALEACPTGWRLPTMGEWFRLDNYAKESIDSYYNGITLRADSLWTPDPLGRDSSEDLNSLGFGALALALYDTEDKSGEFAVGLRADFWSSQKETEPYSYPRAVYFSLGYMTNSYPAKIQSTMMPVRCIKDDGRLGTMLDKRDSVTYKTVKIGKQTWTAENMRTAVGKGTAVCRENSMDECETYGRFYDWQAAKSVCPSGWHLPSKKDFETLYEFAKAGKGGYGEGEVLMARHPNWQKRYDVDLWDFGAIPAGYYKDEKFSEESFAIFWSSTETDDSDSSHYGLYLNTEFSGANIDAFDDSYGASVRCVKDE